MTSALFVVSTADRRGAEVFATELCSLLGSHGIDADVVAIAPGAGSSSLDIPVLGTGRASVRGLARLVARARAHDVVVSNGGTTLAPVAVASALARRPFVYRNIGDPTVWGAVRGSDLRIGAPIRRAAAVAALYPAAGDEIARRYRVPAAAITVIPNAARADRFPLVDDHRRAAARSTLGLTDDRNWVAYVGALSEEKRPLLAIEATRLAPGIGLLVAGDGPLRDECIAAAATLSPGTVRLLGAVEHVEDVYAAADAVVVPSRTEGIPGAAIEAGLSGLPVVAADVGGLGHVVVEGVTGRLLKDPTAAALSAAMLDATHRRVELGAAGAARMREQFSMDGAAAEWARLLRSVASAPS